MIKKLKIYHVQSNAWKTKYYFVVDRFQSQMFNTEYEAIEALLKYTLQLS